MKEAWWCHSHSGCRIGPRLGELHFHSHYTLPTDIDYPHYFPVHRRALSYLFYLVPIKTEWDMWLTHCLRMVWKHIFWWDFCWVSSNSLVDSTDPLNTQKFWKVLNISHWHVLPYILPIAPPRLHSLHSFHKGAVLGLFPKSLNGLKIYLSKGILMQFQ